MDSLPQNDLKPVVTEAQIAEFQENGAVKLPGLLSPRWIEMLRGIAEDAKAAAADNSGYYDEPGTTTTAKRLTVVKDDVWREFPVMRDFLRGSPIASTLARCMRSQTARIYEDLLIYKEAAETMPTPWHQDEPQWPVTGAKMSSAWLSLEETTPETGALRFVAGSHKGPLYIPYVPAAQQDRVQADMRFFMGGKLPEIAADDPRIMCFSTEPGDVVLFHPRSIHAAFGSHSRHPRRTFSIRFLGDDVRWEPKVSVFHDWLRDIPLAQGAQISGERFPQFWPAGADNSN